MVFLFNFLCLSFCRYEIGIASHPCPLILCTLQQENLEKGCMNSLEGLHILMFFGRMLNLGDPINLRSSLAKKSSKATKKKKIGVSQAFSRRKPTKTGALIQCLAQLFLAQGLRQVSRDSSQVFTPQ